MRIERTVRQALCVLVALLLAGALAACSGDGSEGSAREVGPAAPAATARGDTDRDATGDRTSTGGGRGGATTGGGPAAAREAPPAGRSVIYSAELRVRAENVDQAAARAKQLAVSAGGYVESESSSTATGRSTLALKIPADRYPAVLNDLAGQLGRKLYQRQQAEDVTREVADVDSRVKSAEATLASFRKLLDRANTVSEVMQVEEEIARRQADLEALQARQKALQHSTRYATVSVTLESPRDRDAEDDESGGGFVGGLKSGWKAFTAFLSALATALGWLLPFLVLGAVIAVPVVLVLRRLRRRPGARKARGPRPPAGPPAASAPAPGPGPGQGPPPGQGPLSAPGQAPAAPQQGADVPNPPSGRDRGTPANG